MKTPLPKGTLPEIGRLLYGSHWQTELARSLGVSVRAAQKWSTGENQPSHVIWTKIADLISERQHALVEASRRIPLALAATVLLLGASGAYAGDLPRDAEKTWWAQCSHGVLPVPADEEKCEKLGKALSDATPAELRRNEAESNAEKWDAPRGSVSLCAPPHRMTRDGCQ